MADVEKNEQPQTNGLENGLEDEDERTKLRPADIDADVKEMERRKRVEMIMSSKLFREELERIIELQMKDGNGPAGLLQQISDMMGIQSGKLHTTHMFRGSNCVTPINDIRGVESMGYEKGEKNLRCKLACVFRLMDLYGWSQGINNQITARLNQDEEHFLVNPHGMLYNEITASSLVKVDMQGNIVEPGTTNFSVNTQGFLLHSAIQASRPDVKCVIHIKTPSVLAVSSLKCGLLPICQEALVIGEVSQHPFVGGIFEPEEREKIIRNLGPSNKVLLLNNHGAVCCGATVEEAFYNVYNTVLACETQIKVMPLGVDNLVLVSDETRKQVYDAAHRAPDTGAPGDKKPKQFRVGELEFEALIRMLDNAGFRTGYIYRHPLVKGELPKPKNDVEVPPAVSSLGYLIEQEELYKQGNWKKYVDGRNRLDRTKWLNSPNVYQKVEILETGTSDPKKITKWVAESSPTHSSTPVKIDSALQFVPKGTNPKEFKKLQQQIKENRRADKITSGPQSHILEGVSWEEAKKLQDANITHTGDQVILVGAASKGIIQRNYQHNALVYKTPYAKNPFDSMSDKEIEDYKQLVERKQRGDTDYEESQSESEAISSSRQDALRHIKSPLTSPQSATSETEEESRDEPRVLRIETKTAPRPIQAEVVLSDAESDTTDARIERSHSARYPKAEKPESVTLMNSFRKSWSLKREKDKSKDIDNSDGGYDSRNLHPNLMLTECERNRMTSLHWCVARVKQLTHKPVIVDVRTKALRPLLKSASDPCNLSNFPEEDFLETDDDCPTGVSKDPNMSISCNNIVSVSDLQRRLNVRKKLIYSAKMKFLGFHNDTKTKEQEIKEKASTSPMCALISEIRETINEIMSPERSKKSEDVTDDYCSSMRWIERPRVVPREKLIDEDITRSSKFDREEVKKSIYNANNVRSKLFQSLEKPFESLNDFTNYFHDDEKLEFENPNSSNCTSTPHSKGIKSTKTFLNGEAKVDENQNEERIVENVLSEMVQTVNLSDEEATYIIKDDSLLQTYSFTETTETEWYYNKTIMKLDNSQTVLEIKDSNNKTVENQETPIVKYVDTGIDTDFTSEKDNEVMSGQPEGVTQKGGDKLNSTEEVEVEVEVPVCESSVLNKSSETDSSFLKSSSGRTSNDVDTSFAFRTETDNSEKTNDKPEKTLITNHVIEDKYKVNEEELFENVESKRLECHDYNKQKHIEYCASKLPGISESPEYINVDTEDAPVTSSSKDTSPEVVINAVPLIEDEPPEVDKDPEIDPDKDDKPQKSEKKRRRKKNKKSSTKITVKKELKEKNSTEPVVSEIKLTIKNTIQCQSEKYEVKIQDVINTSEELSSSLGENIESHDAFVVENGSCDCDAQQNLEELQEEVSSTIEKLQTIEDYFENEIKKCSDESVKEEIHLVNENPGEYTIEYNYGECEEVLNESQIQMPLLVEVDQNILTDQQIDLNDLSGNEPTTNNYAEDENVIYFVSSVFENIGKEVEVVSCEHDVINLSVGDFKTQDLNSSKYSDASEEQLETKNFDYISMNQDLDKLSQPKIEYVKDFLNEYFSPESKVDVPLDLTRNTVTENAEVEKKLSFSDSENEKNMEVDCAVNDPLETEILSQSEKMYTEETKQIETVENIIPKVEPCEAYSEDITNSPSSDDQVLADFQNAKESLNIPYEPNEKGLKNITEEAPLTAENAENEIFSEVIKDLTSDLVVKCEKLSNDSESSENFCKDEKCIEEQVLTSLENGKTVSVVNANVVVGFGSLNEIYVETNKYEVLSKLSKIENSHYLDGDNELCEDVNSFVQSEERLEECKPSGNLCRVNDRLQAVEVNCSLLDTYETEQSSRIKRLTKSAARMDISQINLSVPKNWFRPTTENLCGQFKIPLSMGSVNMDLIPYLCRENKNNENSNSVIMKNFDTSLYQSVKEMLKSLMHTQVNYDFEKSLSCLKFELHKDPSDCLSKVSQETESENNIFKVGDTSQNVEIELMSYSNESNFNSVSETDIGAEDLQKKDLKQNLQQTTHSSSKSFEEVMCIEDQTPSQNLSLCEKEFSDSSTEISKDVNNLEENKSNCIDEEVLGGTVVDYISSGNDKDRAINSESKKDELDDTNINQNISINVLCDGKTISNTGKEIDEESHKNHSVTETNKIHNVEFLEPVNISCLEPEVKEDFNCSSYSETSKDIHEDAVTVESPKEVNDCLKVEERSEDYQAETNTPDTIFSEVIRDENVSELKNQSMIETNIIQDAVEEKNITCQEPVVKEDVNCSNYSEISKDIHEDVMIVESPQEVTDYSEASEVKASNQTGKVSSEIIGDENVSELKNQSVMENNIIQTVEATDQESIACEEPVVKEDFSCSDCNETGKYILGGEIILESSQELNGCSGMKERSEEHQTDTNVTDKVSGDVIGDENVSHLKDELVIENIYTQNALEEVAVEEIVTCGEKKIEEDSGNKYFNINEDIKEEIAITKTSEEIEDYSETKERSEKYLTVTEILLNILREVVEEKNVSSLEKDSKNDRCKLHKSIPKEIMISQTSQIDTENSQIDFNEVNGDKNNYPTQDKNISEKICSLKIPVTDHFEINLDAKILCNPNNELNFNNLVIKQEGQKLSFNIDLNSDLWKSILSKISFFENSEDIYRSFCLGSNKVTGEMLPFYENNFTNIKFTQNEDDSHLGLCTVEKMFMNFIKLYVSIKEHNPTFSGDFCEVSSNVERILCQSDENPAADDSVLVFLNYLNKKFSPPLQAITWPSVEVKEEDKLKQSGQARKRLDFSNEASNDPVDYVLNVLINSVCKESTVNDVINFMLTNEESPTDSLAEFEDMETIFSTSNMIVTDIIDSIESQMEGDVDSLPEEEEVKDNKDDRLNKEGKKKKSESMFKVIIATPTKKEIFINYSPNSSSIFNVSDYDKPEFCNSYIKTDDINEDFENLSSDNLEFFSVGSPSKNSFNSSFDSICSDLDGNMANPVQCCCMNCDNFGQKSPRSLAIIEEVDEGDSSTSSDYVSSKLDKIQK